jgi:prepilin peptidase CpaA
MGEASLLYTWIDILSIVSALLAVLAAAAIDYRTMKIPNRLTFPFIFLGLSLLVLRCLAGFSLSMAGFTCIVAYVFVYVLWKCGLWGGGDAKLVLALFILITPVYPSLKFMVIFSISLATVLFLKHSLWRALKVRRNDGFVKPLSAMEIVSLREPLDAPSPMGPSLLVAYVIAIMAFTAGLVP